MQNKVITYIKDNKNYIMPTAVLTAIVVVCVALVVLAYNFTYVDTTGIITDKLDAGLQDVLGKGSYEMILNENNEGKKVPLTYDGITSIIKDENGQLAFEIVTDGYAKNGLHVLVGIDTDGAVTGVSIITIGETPGLGTKVNDKTFLDKFKGINDSPEKVDNVTGATYSSKGMKKAVSLALETYKNKREEILK